LRIPLCEVSIEKKYELKKMVFGGDVKQHAN